VRVAVDLRVVGPHADPPQSAAVKPFVTVSNALLSAIVDGAPLPDADKPRLLAEVGVSPEAVRDIQARTSIRVLARLWKRIVRATGDELVGLHIGTAIPGHRFGLAARAATQGDDLRQVLVRFAKYATLVNDLLECRLEEAPPLARFTARLSWDVLGLERPAVDLTFASVVGWARQHLTAPLVVHELRLQHARATGRRTYEALFRCPIVFGAERNELVFDATALDARVSTRDPELGLLLDRYASLELAATPVVTDLPARLAQLLRRQLQAGTPVDLATVAGLVQMTPRRLQRRLREHATSCSVLVEDARRALAPELLAAPDANVEQVGFRLGYSEPTAFIRAFKKWYGQTPGSFRRAKWP
jgi:AraC-like DNA-binding protein